MTDDWNVRRKARGRIRRAKTRRRRQRITAASLMLLFLLTVLAAGSVNYGKTRSAEINVANQHKVRYTIPKITPLLARAEAVKPDSQLPQVLNFDERFPDYRNPPQVDDPGDQSSGTEDTPSVDAAQSMVILDDLRAAPPKSMFIDAVFENNDGDPQPEQIRAPRWQFTATADDGAVLLGHPQRENLVIPSVPEPGSGALLSLGLIGLAIRHTRNARRADATNR